MQVAYCAEQFENDGSPVSTIVKGVKRAMAGEYSRELSAKVFAGQCRLIELGFRQGGPAGYGLRRVLIDQHGIMKSELQRGEQKSLQTDRVVLMPGPESEIRIVNLIYNWFIEESLNEYEIAARLNGMRVRTDLDRDWTRATVREVLTNEKYIGNNVYNRVSFKLKKIRVVNTSDTWIRKEGAFQSIVSSETFYTAQGIMRARARHHSNEELIERLRNLYRDTLEHEWNDKLRTLANAREERERSQQQDRLALDDAIRDRLIAMTTDFKTLWRDQSLPNRERKRLLAYIIEDVTLVKLPEEGTTRIHVRFKAGRTETLMAQNPKSSAQQVKTRPEVLELIDKLLDSHTCSEIADILNNQGIRPGGCVRPGKADIRFTALRVSYLAQRNGLRSRRDRLKDRGMLTRPGAAARLGIHEATLVSWVRHGLVTRHAYNDYASLYEVSDLSPPTKHCSRWDRLTDRVARMQAAQESKPSHPIKGVVV
jgi:hypothetical protein